ncbi:MAG: NlpC/P60 family protein [Marinosulfonomonas sp.]
MADARSLRSNGRVAHSALAGLVQADRFSDGQWMQVGVAVAPILGGPEGPRIREMLFGQEFCVLDTMRGYAFGFTRHDGYCGYVQHDFLHEAPPATHVVTTLRTYHKPSPDLKSWEPHSPLHFGSRVAVTEVEKGWARVALPKGHGFAPEVHLSPLPHSFDDPVAVAEKFLGAPYLWGGNSASGLDCSGLVQASLLACGVDCPGDADQQARDLGGVVGNNTAVHRGDLFFWAGHVAIALDEDRLIHANAHAMAVSVETISGAIERIARQGEGDVTVRKRL